MRDAQATLATQLSLLPGPGVITWLPDELVFSLASRHHVVSGNHLASETCNQLFGHPRRGYQHDFPGGIDEFVRRTGGVLGNALEVICEHTILPFYLPLRSPQTAHEAIASLRHGGMGPLKYRLGLLTSRFRAHHPLKACPECMEDDRHRFHVAYWHLCHQYPGVWLCPKHACWLMESTVKSNGVGRFLWHLPEISLLNDVVMPTQDHYLDEKRIDFFRRIADASVKLASLPSGFLLDPYRLSQIYSDALLVQGMFSAKGKLKKKEAAHSFMASIYGLNTVPEFVSLPSSLAEAEQQILRMLREPRGGTHPLRHLIFIIWLFGTWDTFWKRYQNAESEKFGPRETLDDMAEPGGPSSKDGRCLDLIELIATQGYSITRAADVIGVDTVTAMSWATQAGFNSPRRPKLLKPDIRSKLIEDLRAGLDKKTAAARYEISVQTVTTTLRTVVDLHRAWSDSRFKLTQNRSRNLWITISTENPSMGIKSLRLLEPAAYAWLYRNDRIWLDAQKGLLSENKRGNHSNVDWDSRDQEYAQNIRRVCLEIVQETNAPKKITLQEIYLRLPQLRPKLGKLERLPLTRRAIEIATGKRKVQRKPGQLFD